VLTRDYFITICLDSHQVLEEFAAEGPRTFSTYKKTRFLFQLLYKSALLYLKYLKQINRSTDEIERDLRQSVKNQEIFQLLELQKGLTYFTASLRSNGIVLERLLRLRSNRELQHLIAVYEEDEDLLEDVIIENKQAIEMVEMYSNVLSGMMGAFTSIISNNLNRVLKFLAAVTILLAIPTMVQFLGMNVEGPPLQRQKWVRDHSPHRRGHRQHQRLWAVGRRGLCKGDSRVVAPDFLRITHYCCQGCSAGGGLVPGP
jgi:magnesium transporter